MSKVFQRGFDINDKKWFSNKEIIIRPAEVEL